MNSTVMNELISIILPVYRVEPYLRECLDSVINQTYTNLEIILVDDGSPDNCGAICDEYAGKDSRIKVIHKENGGISDARNYGLDIMTGKYYTFVDSDDIVHPRFIEILYKLITNYNTDISMCGLSFHYDGEPLEFKDIDDEPDVLVMNEYQYASGLVSEFKLPYSVVWNKLFRTDRHGSLRFPKGMIFEDTLYLTDLMRIGITCAKTEAPLYMYRQRKNSLSYTKNVDYLLESSKVTTDQYLALKERYGEAYRSALFCKVLNSLSRRATDVYWNLDKNEAKKFYDFWVEFYNSDKKYIKGAKEKAKTLLYRYFPHLYYYIMKKKIFTSVKAG